MDWKYGNEPREHFRVEAARIEVERGTSLANAPTHMKWEFETDAAGLVWVAPDENYPGFSAALADALGPLGPAGGPPTQSTYWIDRALTWLDAAEDEDPPLDLAAGNSTSLQRDGQTIKAIALYETFEMEELPIVEVMHGLLRWRRAILDRIARVGDRVPTNDAGAVVGMRSPPP